MGILNKLSINEIINAIKTQNKKLICSVPGVGQKMSDRLFLELKNKYKNEIKFILPILIKEVDLLAKRENNLSFEYLLKLAMNYLDKDSSNLAR